LLKKEEEQLLLHNGLKNYSPLPLHIADMSLFDAFDPYNVLFLDIETVPGVAEFEELDEELQELWGIKCRSLLRRGADEEVEYDEMAELYKTRAGIYAEFGKIICVSVGFLTRQPDSTEPIMRLKSFSNHVEASCWKISVSYSINISTIQTAMPSVVTISKNLTSLTFVGVC